MLKLEYGDLKAQIPDQWYEFSKEDFVFVVTALSKMTAYEAQLTIILRFLPENWRSIIHYLSDNELNQLRKSYDFLLEEPSFKLFFFTEIKIGLNTFYGPTNYLNNLTVREFSAAEFYIQKFALLEKSNSNKAIEFLNRFCASIFYKTSSKGRIVPKSTLEFDELVKKKANDFALVDLPIKLAIAHNFSACRNCLFQQFEDAFSKSGKKSKASKYGWDGIVQHHAFQQKMIPDLIYSMNLLEFLTQLDTVAIQLKEKES